MDFSLVYLVERFFYRIFDFFHHWYDDGTRSFGRSFINTLTKVDQSIALKVTLRHFFEPLYKDYSIIGRIMGVIFRSARVVIGVAVYLFLLSLFLFIYLAWLATPILILYYAAKTF